MADLSTTYMGLKLRNPIIVGSCDLTGSLTQVLRCEEMGAGAVVLKSIFEEQFAGDVGSDQRSALFYPEAIDYLESGGLLEYATRKTCQMIEEAKSKVQIPVIASVNCRSPKLWPTFARHLVEAGADGLELNIYFLPFDLETPGAKYEDSHLEILREVKKSVGIPVAVKLSPFLTSLPHLSKRLVDAGSAALVLFNWFLQPEIDTAHIKTRNVIGKGDYQQSLKWTALLAGRIKADIACSGGVRQSDHVIKLILAGASAVQVASLFYQEGLEALQGLLRGLEEWMDGRSYGSIEDFKGELSYKSQTLSLREPEMVEAYFRAQYLKTYLKKE